MDFQPSGTGIHPEFCEMSCMWRALEDGGDVPLDPAAAIIGLHPPGLREQLCLSLVVAFLQGVSFAAFARRPCR